MRWFFGCLGIAGLLLGITDCRPIEGERCNPLLFSDECSEGTQCTYPAHCGVAYCCPLKVTGSSGSSCQACPAPDGGMD